MNRFRCKRKEIPEHIRIFEIGDRVALLGVDEIGKLMILIALAEEPQFPGASVLEIEPDPICLASVISNLLTLGLCSWAVMQYAVV